MARSITTEHQQSAVSERSTPAVQKVPQAQELNGSSKPNWYVRLFRAMFRYRKTTLTLLVLITLMTSVLLSYLDNSLEHSVDLPLNVREKATLDYSWSILQEIGKNEHTYTSRHNDEVHDYLELEIKSLITGVRYAEYDNDLNYTNNLMFQVKYPGYDSVSYYESNNLLVRINGSDSSLPAFLLSSHFDSVPSSYGTTDDGMGVASMMGVLRHLCSEYSKQPQRTIIFNFNNNEEFGLYGAKAFLNHPWSQQVRYFLNLEGTGAGGKAVLFRGTDYGIVKHYSSVRYPYANSLFQQGFNNDLIRSETDYVVYKDLGHLRGLDLAFFKPRDIYHTAGDSIKNTNVKSLWHMLSNTLDFTKHIISGEINLDSVKVDTKGNNSDAASYISFMNFFLCAAISQVFAVNIVFLVVGPCIVLLLFFFVFRYKKGWDVNFVNSTKFPLSLMFSVCLLSFVTDVLLVLFNLFIANNSVEVLVLTLFSIFMLSNYLFLNLFNLVFRLFKGHQHDEKLVLFLQIFFLSWIVLFSSSVKLSQKNPGDDHTGEALFVVLYCAPMLTSTIGLLGWMIHKSKQSKPLRAYDDQLPLLGLSASAQHGASDVNSLGDCSLLSLYPEDIEGHARVENSFYYDWFIQFVLMVPVPSFIICNWGYLIVDGLHKSIQESAGIQGLIYKVIQIYVIAWAIIFIPFVFKLNRSIVLIFLGLTVSGLLILGTKAPFDAENPLKLHFVQTLDVDSVPAQNVVIVMARLSSYVSDVLADIPSLKIAHERVHQESIGDGMLLYSWNSTLVPHVVPGIDSINDYLHLEVLKNSSTSSDAPFGLLTGELRISAPKNRNCKLSFTNSHNSVKISENKEQSNYPVKRAIIYDSNKTPNETYLHLGGIPEGFSRDHNGNYLFRSSQGIKELQLNKLDWDVPYHLSVQWVPEVVDSRVDDASSINVIKLGVEVKCYWSELGAVSDGREGDFSVFESVPAYQELLHYSPNYVSWANLERGLVSVRRYIEI